MYFDILLLVAVQSLQQLLVLPIFRFFKHAPLSGLVRLLGLIQHSFIILLRPTDVARVISHRNYYEQRLNYQKLPINLRFKFLDLARTNFLGSYR